MVIDLVMSTLHTAYCIPCNIAGEPEYHLPIKEEYKPWVQAKYEVFVGGEAKVCSFSLASPIKK